MYFLDITIRIQCQKSVKRESEECQKGVGRVSVKCQKCVRRVSWCVGKVLEECQKIV